MVDIRAVLCLNKFMDITSVWRRYPDAETLAKVVVRLIRPEERERWDATLDERHYLKGRLVGPTLRYVAELDGEWVCLASIGQAAYHLRDRESWIGWNDVQRGRRLSLVGQNTRFLLLGSRGETPNLASRVLGLLCARASADWEQTFGNPLVAIESFVDPQLFSGSCYAASGWQRLGATRGFGRSRRDFYQEHNQPKDLWVRVLDRRGFRSLSSARLPSRLRPYEREWRPCPFRDKSVAALFDLFADVPDRRGRRGRRYGVRTLLTLLALAAACGHTGSRAVASFAAKLTDVQRRRLGCPFNRITRQYAVPSETCLRLFCAKAHVTRIEGALACWMDGLDPEELRCIALDGKTLKGSARRGDKGTKEGALQLVAASAHHNGRLLGQTSVPVGGGEITAVQELLRSFPHLHGLTVTADAINTQQETARIIVQEKGGPTTCG
jgi:hypothetical protein